MGNYSIKAEKERRFWPKRFDLETLGPDGETGFTNGSDRVLFKFDGLGSLRIISEGPYPVTVESDEISVLGQLVVLAETRVLSPSDPGMIARAHRIRVFPSPESGKSQRLLITYQI